MRKIFFILVALSVWGEVFGQNDESIRTPKVSFAKKVDS
jgi:hypothetical protein